MSANAFQESSIKGGRQIPIDGSRSAPRDFDPARLRVNPWRRACSAQRSTPMELFIFARFDAREGHEAAVAAALSEQVAAVRAEPGCLAIAAYRSVRDPRLFWIHSRWIDEAAFEIHAELPRTQRFVERAQ